ncbi:hypothetical protein [Paenibacillus wynnii]|uniref:Type IV secretion system coupling protein TraD DNA-binding domain-containing protein n=1 Tax=Paenibacillus wynnii TaxID=268407 RepID=A0A098M3T3_9BACL|nr:hypothetical protein [Paenibacillus wynnii]KGE16247.1 hypothetical protein PWYN_15920 [Paenibacillus wynnii]
MKAIKFSQALQIIHPEYVYLRLKPSNGIRNNNTHKLARVIASLYKNAVASVRKEEEKVIRVLGKELAVPTAVSYSLPAKVAYMIYIEKQKVEFYFILPRQHLTFLREKLGDVWPGLTIEEVQVLPVFGEGAARYYLSYAKEDALSLAVDRRSNDWLTSSLNTIEGMEEGDRASVLINLMPTSQFSWRSSYRATIEKVRHGMPVDRDKMGTGYLLRMVVSMLTGLAATVSEVLGGERKESAANPFEGLLHRLNGGGRISEATERKATAPIVNTQLVVLSESVDVLRQRNTARSLSQSFDTVSGDNSLVPRPFRGTTRYTDYLLHGATVNKMGDEECSNFLALAGRDLLDRYDFIDKVETQETEVPADLQQGVMRIGDNRFRGNDQPAYLSNDSEYKNLTLVLIGPTRAGKSTLIGNLSHDAIAAGECVVIFDYVKNCELSSEVSALFPPAKTLTIDCGNIKTMQGLGYNEVGSSADPFIQYDNAKKQTTQLMTLINSINADDTRLSAKMERYLTSAALVVFVSTGSIRDVFGVLQDHEVRHKFINIVPASQVENLAEYIGSLRELDEYKEVKVKEDGVTKSYPELIGTKEHLITGVIDRLNKLKANTYMEMMLKKSTVGNIDLAKKLQKNQLITIRMPETMFSTDGERDVYTTYWITKLWLALQARGQQVPDRNKLTKVNIVFDELYQVQNTEKFLTGILSRLAKFGAKPIISCHYLNQLRYIREELRSANASYMLISGCDKKNYAELKDELAPFELEDLLKLPRFRSMNLIKNKTGYARFITTLPKPIQ